MMKDKMNKMQKILLAGMVGVILALAVGCGPLGRPNPAGNGGSSGVGATPTGMVGGDESTPSDTVTVTLADNGKEITLKQGNRLLVKLGEEYTWQLTNSDITVLIPVRAVMLVRGAQGLYDAARAEQSVISGPGDPTCLTAEPACMMPSIEFKVTVNVE
jgi:hypothetical protein